MKNFHTIDLQFSENHLLFPRIIMVILLILIIIMAIQAIVKRMKEGKMKSFNLRFFIKNYDKLKFYGTIVLLVAYAYFLVPLGFLLSSILFMFLITLLYKGDIKGKSIPVSIANSLITSIAIWYVFGHIFNITLP